VITAFRPLDPPTAIGDVVGILSTSFASFSVDMATILSAVWCSHEHTHKSPTHEKVQKVSLLLKNYTQKESTRSVLEIEKPWPVESSAPIKFGPNGSGSKGSGVSQSAYASCADIYGYRGSYNSQNGSQRQPPELPENSGSLGDGGGGGGGGPPGGVTMNGNIINNAQFVPEEFWTCVCPDDVWVRCPLLMFHSVTATDKGE
jgi:hypothetical protein